MQALVEHFALRGEPERVERCVLHLSIAALDIDQARRARGRGPWGGARLCCSQSETLSQHRGSGAGPAGRRGRARKTGVHTAPPPPPAGRPPVRGPPPAHRGAVRAQPHQRLPPPAGRPARRRRRRGRGRRRAGRARARAQAAGLDARRHEGPRLPAGQRRHAGVGARLALAGKRASRRGLGWGRPRGISEAAYHRLRAQRRGPDPRAPIPPCHPLTPTPRTATDRRPAPTPSCPPRFLPAAAAIPTATPRSWRRSSAPCWAASCSWGRTTCWASGAAPPPAARPRRRRRSSLRFRARPARRTRARRPPSRRPPPRPCCGARTPRCSCCCRSTRPRRCSCFPRRRRGGTPSRPTSGRRRESPRRSWSA
jgi:hypothetical protein